MSEYVRPTTLDEALARLAERPHRVLAGGTDVYPAEAAARGWGGPGLEHPDAEPILDLSAVAGLAAIDRLDDRVEIGALVTWNDAIRSGLPAWFDAVRLAAGAIGGRQIQNRGTLAGNLCNASPAADGVPALLALDARVSLVRLGGAREIPLGEFITGNRRTCLAPGELVGAIVIPRPGASARSTFVKLGARRYLVISIAMVAVCIETDAEGITCARVAVGACSEVAQRLTELERRLVGAPPRAAAELVRDEDLATLSPLDDVRASATYRRHGAAVLLRRALASLADGALAA